MRTSIKIRPKKSSSRFVALDARNHMKIVAEGTSAHAVVQKAQKTGKAFSMMYLPPQGKTFIYGRG